MEGDATKYAAALPPIPEPSLTTAAVRRHALVALRQGEVLGTSTSEITTHGQAVARHSEKTMEALGFDETEVRRLHLAGALHDIGKALIPRSILCKPGLLTPDEWAQVREHPTVGAQMLKAAGLDEIVPDVLAHHERFDGRGYPYGLGGDEIPLGGRVLAAADAYDAMTSARPYRAAMTVADAQGELLLESGKQFDPQVVEAFLSVVGDSVSDGLLGPGGQFDGTGADAFPGALD